MKLIHFEFQPLLNSLVYKNYDSTWNNFIYPLIAVSRAEYVNFVKYSHQANFEFHENLGLNYLPLIILKHLLRDSLIYFVSFHLFNFFFLFSFSCTSSDNPRKTYFFFHPTSSTAVKFFSLILKSFFF